MSTAGARTFGKFFKPPKRIFSESPVMLALRVLGTKKNSR